MLPLAEIVGSVMVTKEGSRCDEYDRSASISSGRCQLIPCALTFFLNSLLTSSKRSACIRAIAACFSSKVRKQSRSGMVICKSSSSALRGVSSSDASSCLMIVMICCARSISSFFSLGCASVEKSQWRLGALLLTCLLAVRGSVVSLKVMQRAFGASAISFVFLRIPKLTSESRASLS